MKFQSCTRRLIASAAVFPLVLANQALAQTDEDAAVGSAVAEQPQVITQPASDDGGDIVVTGSLIRGVAAVGSPLLSIGAEDVKRIGAVNTNQILSQVPMITNAFNTVTATGTTTGTSTFRPNLRNISAAGGNTTLVLMDGHTMVGSGILQTTPDAGFIPPGAIERVEVMADGGSSLYGSDAVGGIINMITRRKFDGIEAGVRYGGASDYRAGELSLTGGTAWPTGSFMATLSARANTILLSEDRGRPRQNLTSFGGRDFRVRACAPGTIAANGTTYALPNRQPATFNLCDLTALGTIAPKEEQYSGFMSFTQELSEIIEFNITGLAGYRDTTSRLAQIGSNNLVINATNPFFSPVVAEASQTVSFNYGSVLGSRLEQRSQLWLGQVTPSLKFRLPGAWQINLLGNYGHSFSKVNNPGINSAAEAAAVRGPGLTTSTALNPYNLALTNPAVIANIANWTTFATNRQTFTGLRVQGDGPLFSLPGGDVRVAIGAEYQRHTVKGLLLIGRNGDFGNASHERASRDIQSLFGEVLIPLVSEDNGIPLIRELKLDASLRYDGYSDVGDTINPKIGAHWEIFDGFSVRGNYGTSFNAPSLADTVGGVGRGIQVVPTTNIRPGDSAANATRPTLVIAGGTATLQPQTADTWSVGADFKPTFLPGLELGGTYWNVSLEKTIGLIPFTSATVYSIPGYSSLYILNPTLAQAQALSNNLPVIAGATSLQALYGIGNDPYVIVDARRKNLGFLWVAGVDFHLAYRQDTSWGGLYGSLDGTRLVNRKSQAVVGAVTSDLLLANLSKLSIAATVGGHVGNFRASATVRYTDGYAVTGLPRQTHVDSFAPVNLYFSYGLEDVGLKEAEISLNIDNVFDTQPPFIDQTGGIPTTTSTLGRFVALGVRMRF